MRNPIALIAALALAACTSGGETEADAPEQPVDTVETPETLAAMPEAFLGRWDFSEDSCGDPASEMRLDIQPELVTFYESQAVPTTITQSEPGSLVVGHRFSGEGEEWTEQLAYELSEDGDRLTVTSPNGSLSIRMRCPG